jgi:hypothetical protein
VNSVDIPLEGKIKSVVTFADRTPLQYKHRNGRLTLDVTIPANTPDYIIEVTLK